MQNKKPMDFDSFKIPAWGETENEENSFSFGLSQEKETDVEQKQSSAQKIWITCPVCKQRNCPLGYFITVES